MRLLAPTASASLLVRLSLVPHRAHALCSSAAALQRVHLKLDAPVRHLFEPQKKRVSLRLPSTGALPLQALRAALRERCGDESVEPLLEIRHGKRRIESDKDLARVLAATATYRCDGPTLQVVARSGSQLPPPPPAASPCLSSSSIETDSSPGRFCASSRMFAPVKSDIVTRTAAASVRVAGSMRCMPPRKARVE
mmetsp:Transcript_23240/g.78441  ORF Transcript_23240/g.78441 Transcript_23240/m.78441 type:complete len:195 (-) Transcript_23240:1417-2001(-)